MKKLIFFLTLLLSLTNLISQENPIYGSKVIVRKRDTSSAEFQIINSTRNVSGFLKNTGGGNTIFKIPSQSEIAALPDSLLSRYTKTQADARFKSISYIPDWLELTGVPSNFSTTYALSNDIQDSLLNKVTRSGSYADPSWITSINYSKLVGTVPTWNQNTTGNAATVTNGVYTTGSYTNPAWIVSLDYSKLTGTVPTWNQNTTGNAATVTNGVYTTGSYADPSWITSLGWSKISGAPAFITGINSSMVTTALGYTPENISNKGIANGYADLDAGGKIPASRIDFGQTGQTFVVASQAAMLAVSGANIGALAVRTDESKNYRLIAQPASTLGNWQLLLSPDAPVQSVNGFTGNVNLLTTHISEGSNYWWTAARSRAAQSLTVSGSSGSATYDNTTGVLNIPTYTLAGLGGQPALSGTGFVKISGTTITYDNSTYLTSYTETDPTIYAWAKATTKPSYSWGEITGTVPTWNQNTTGTAGSLSAVLSKTLGGAGDVNGILKANGSGVVSAAVAGTDYVVPSALNSYVPYSGATGAVTLGTNSFTSGAITSNATTAYTLFQSGNTTDQKYWALQNIPIAGTFRIRAINDAQTDGINAIAIDRTGISSVSIALGGTLNGTSLSMSGNVNALKGDFGQAFTTSNVLQAFSSSATDANIFQVGMVGVSNGFVLKREASVFKMEWDGQATFGGTLSGTSLSMSGGGSFLGDLGVGTASPSGIGRTINAYGGASVNSNLVLEGNAGASFISILSSATVGVGSTIFAKDGIRFGRATAKDATGFVEDGRFASDGTFLINTTTTDGTNKLIVNGGVKASNGALTVTNGTISNIVSYASGGIIGTTSNHSLDLYTNNTSRLSITSTGAATFSSSVTAGSNISINGNGTSFQWTNTGNNVAMNATSGVWKVFTGTSSYVEALSISATQAATFSSSVTVGGAVSVGTTLGVTGATTLDSTVQINGNGTKLNWFNSGFENWYIGTKTSTTQFVLGYGTTNDVLTFTNTGTATFSSTIAASSSLTLSNRTVFAVGYIADNAASGNNIGIAFGSGGIVSTNGAGSLTPQNLGTTSNRWAAINAQTGDFSSTVTATGFIKSGSSDSYFLLGGGGHVATSTYATTASLSSYVNTTGNQYEIGGNKSFLGAVEVVSLKTTGGPGTPGVLKFGGKTNDTVFTAGSQYVLPVNIDGTTYYIRLWAGVN